MPLSFLVPVNPEFPILRFTSLVSNYCSVPVQQTFLFLCYLLIFICVGGRVIFLPCILVYTSFHFVHEMYVLRKFHHKPSCHEPYCLSLFCSNSAKCRTNIVQTLFALHKYEILDLPCLRTSKLDLPVVS